MITFVDQQEYEAQAFALVARFVFDRAASVIAGGVCADVAEEVLTYLQAIAIDRKCNAIAITTYLEIIASENISIRELL